MTTTEDRTLRYIDSDGHILEPPTAMLDFAPAEYRDRIWHIETDSDGVEWMVYNGVRNQAGGLAGTAGFSDEMVERVRNLELGYTDTRPSGWTADLRLKDLDTDGIELSVLYPTQMLGLQSLHDVEFGRVQARAYNDWCAEHLRAGQGRLFGAGALPPIHAPERRRGGGRGDPARRSAPGHGVGVHAPEPGHRVALLQRPRLRPDLGQRCRRRGSRSPSTRSWLPTSPAPASGSSSPASFARTAATSPLEEFEAALRAAGDTPYLPNIYFTQAIANPVDVMSAICYVISGGVAERFPGTKFMFLEANGGWLVPWLERLDHHAKKFSWDVPWLKMLPSEYFRRQCWISFDPDESMLAFTANSPLCGADRIIWASDYPHPDAKFPGVTEELTEALEGLTFEQQRAITSESALSLYGLT